MFYPLFSLSELPDRLLGFILSQLRHPLIINIIENYFYASRIIDNLCPLTQLQILTLN